MKSGLHSFVKDAQKFYQEGGVHLQLNYPDPVCSKEDGEKITGSRVKACLATVRQRKYEETVELEKSPKPKTKVFVAFKSEA